MVDNFNIIKNLLIFPSKDSFYFLQILQRKKDNNQIGSNSRVIKTYYITSVEQLDLYKEEIVKLCEVFNARASINLNPRNFKKTGYAVLRKIADQMHNDDFYSIRKAYDSVCGEYQSEIDRRWVVDIDTQDENIVFAIESYINEILDYPKGPTIDNHDYRILAKIPSKNGVHIICNPFNMEVFRQKFPEIDVLKNNPTNIYIP